MPVTLTLQSAYETNLAIDVATIILNLQEKLSTFQPWLRVVGGAPSIWTISRCVERN